jgi:hypothetical protein
MDKAQEFKRKWTLEGNTGKTSKSHNNTSKSKLLSVANELDIVGVDGNPQVLDRMISLDNQRSLDRKVENSCSTSTSTNTGMSLGDNGGNQDDKDLSLEEDLKVKLGGLFVADQDQDLPNICPRKKKKTKEK